MKLQGKTTAGSNIQVIVIPRGEDSQFIFKAAPVVDYTAFDAICPRPNPPVTTRAGGQSFQNVHDKQYVEELNRWGTYKTHWLVLESLKATPELVWDTVIPDDPTTWKNYATELKDFGLTEPEISRIIQLVCDACGLNQDKIDAATKSFLAMTPNL